jgi:hypothetical protein
LVGGKALLKIQAIEVRKADIGIGDSFVSFDVPAFG